MNRAAWQAYLERLWYDPALRPPLWLRLLAGVHAALAASRRACYRFGLFRVHRLPVPVIVVGNISVGGTGKTPLTLALIEALRQRGWKPGVISRGYGARAEGPLLVGPGTLPEEVGDEPCLIRRRSAAAVAIGRDRVAVGRLLLAAAKPDVLIADDGLQHYALVRNVEICVIDGVRRFGNGRLLPAGPLRESIPRLAAVDFRVCNGGAAQSGEYPMQLVGAMAEPLLGTPGAAASTRALAEFAGQRVHAVAAIGNPPRFFAHLRSFGIEPIEHAWPDHHDFSSSDLAFADALPVLMTEKDAVKCISFAQPDWFQVPVRAELPAAFFDAVLARLAPR